jgi:hypothetical protein
VSFFLFFFLRQGLNYVAQAAPEHQILLPQLPECWDYSCAPLHLAHLAIIDPSQKLFIQNLQVRSAERRACVSGTFSGTR